MRYFNEMVKKNPKSRFYNSPNAYEMMLIFNQILSDSSDINLTMNSLKKYNAGSDYILEPFGITEDDNDAQLSIVWSDKKYKYTPGDPSAENINVTLIEPSGKPSSVRPDIAEDGYCIYNLHNVQPGDWKLLIQYSTREAIGGTAGGFEFHTSIKTDLLLPANIKNGERFDIKIASRDDRQIDELSVKANISRPDYNIDEVLDRFAGELNSVQLDNDAENNQYTLLKKLRARKLQDESIDILPLKHLTLTSDFSGVDGDCSLSMDDTGNTGAYNVNVEIRGVDPVTKRPFKSLKAGTVIVE
jgi:hypothetical protein